MSRWKTLGKATGGGGFNGTGQLDSFRMARANIERFREPGKKLVSRGFWITEAAGQAIPLRLN
jgi:hypothetical protein